MPTGFAVGSRPAIPSLKIPAVPSAEFALTAPMVMFANGPKIMKAAPYNADQMPVVRSTKDSTSVNARMVSFA